MPTINPNSLKIVYVILIATRKFAIQKPQQKVGYDVSSKWTHVAGSLGGLDAVEVNIPRSRVINLQEEYVDKGFEIKVMPRREQLEQKRYKVALWWATMNNLPYDILQFFWFPLSVVCGKAGVICIIFLAVINDFFALNLLLMAFTRKEIIYSAGRQRPYCRQILTTQSFSKK